MGVLFPDFFVFVALLRFLKKLGLFFVVDFTSEFVKGKKKLKLDRKKKKAKLRVCGPFEEVYFSSRSIFRGDLFFFHSTVHSLQRSFKQKPRTTSKRSFFMMIEPELWL